MTRFRGFVVRPGTGLVISTLLVALATWVLFLLQHALRPSDDEAVRPYAITYILIVSSVAAVWGGRVAFFALGLSVLATDFVLIEPRGSIGLGSPADWVELIALLVVGALVTVSIEEARRAGEESRRRLAESEEARARLRTLMDTAPVGVMTCAPDGVLQYANQEAERIWGQPLHQTGIAGWGRYRLLYPDGTPIPPERMGLARALAGEADVIRNEIIIERPDGKRVWVSSSSTRVLDEKNNLLGGLTVFSDITERKRGEEALKASEERTRLVIDIALDAVIAMDAEGRITGWNAQAETIFGWPRDEAHGKLLAETIIPPAFREAHTRGLQHFLATGEGPVLNRRIELIALRRGGEEFPVELAISPVPAGGSFTFSAFVRDITERKRAEDERKRAEEERGNLLRQAQIRAERAALLNRIGQAQRASEDPEEIQTVAARALGQALRADRCFFTTLNLNRDQVTIGRGWQRADLPGHEGEYRPSDLQTDLAALFRGGATLVVENIHTHPALQSAAATIEMFGLQALVAVPLFEENRLTSTLTVAMNQPRAWTREEIALVEAVAAQTRTTMGIAVLLQRERNIAVHLQEALTPPLPAGVPGLDLDKYYTAALREANVGGDFYDVFALDSHCTALIVGDLSGKGLEAASQVAQVRNMLRYALYRGRTLAGALNSLNEILTRHHLLSGFATLFVGLYDAPTGKLSYASCGNEPALLRRADSGAIEELPPTGPVIGVFPDARYEEQEITLAPGDTLAVFTDGLTEAGRSRHELLGVLGIADLLRHCPPAPAAGVVERIVAGVDEHAGPQVDDDRCLLVAVAEGKGM